MIIQHVADIAEICYRKGIEYVVISPGSRSAHLTISFARHQGIKKIVIPDERAAGYIAMGIAQQTGSTVALVCTSGTASINFYPAIAESFYQNVPLLVLTADRPAEWIDKNDGQTIRQTLLYQNHIKKSYTFPQSADDAATKRHATYAIDEAINISRDFPQGPVHVNVPIKEPFYPVEGEKIEYSTNLRLTEIKQSTPQLSTKQLNEELKKLHQKKVLIVPGQGRFNHETVRLLDQVMASKKIPVLSDIISNTFQGTESFRHHDSFINKSLPAPDILITFGRSIISKKLKLFLRNNKMLEHWHISGNDYPADTFLALTQILHTPVNSVLKALLQSDYQGSDAFFMEYEASEKRAKTIVESFADAADFGEFKAVKKIFDVFPEDSNLHLANSMAVRYANIFNSDKNIEVFANRGTSGIDGCTSTAVGHSLITTKLNTILTGDMAFFYDRNALWHNYSLFNLRIIILNNHGGGIFRLIDGPSTQPELEEYFETCQKLNAKNTASDFGLDYYLCKSENELNDVLSDFFQPSENGKILEIETNKIVNQKVFSNYKSVIEHGT